MVDCLTNRLRAYLRGEAQDEWTGRKHADGTPCKAETPETCPFNASAEKADEGVSEKQTAKEAGNPEKVAEKDMSRITGEIGKGILWTNGLTDAEYEALEEKLDDLAFGFGGKVLENLEHEGDGEYSSGFSANVFQDYDGVRRNEDGEWEEVTKLSPNVDEEGIKEDLAKMNGKVAEMGLEAMADDYEITDMRSVNDGNFGYKFVANGKMPLKLVMKDVDKFRNYIKSLDVKEPEEDED